jgi:hypothetical protein
LRAFFFGCVAVPWDVPRDVVGARRFAGGAFFASSARLPGAKAEIAKRSAISAMAPAMLLRLTMPVIVHRAPMSMHRLGTARRSMASVALAALLAGTVVGSGACRTRSTPSAGAPAPSAALAGPRFCPQDLSGVWVNASDTTYAYRLRDHGDQVDGLFFHRAPDGGVVPPEPTEEPMTIELHRTASALAGAMHSYDRSAKGALCPVEFGLSVTSCKPASLQVVSEIAAPIQDDCTRQREPDGGESAPDLSEFIWERPDAGG